MGGRSRLGKVRRGEVRGMGGKGEGEERGWAILGVWSGLV